MSLLNLYSTPAERQRKCVFAERFDGAANLAKNGGVISGSATWVSNGLQFNTTSTYVQYSTRCAIMNYAWPVWAGVIEFTPNFAANDGVQHSFAASTNYHTYHSSGNDIRISCNGVFAIICTLAEYTSYWVTGAVNRIAWSCASGANYLYLNGVLVKSSNTAWTAGTNTNIFFGNSSSNGFTGIMHSAKIFTPSTAAQALTPKDCEVLSAGTTYTYWNSATCIMDGLAANYDPANYRHLDISGRGNHVLLGNGVINGPTKLSAQGYGFSTAQFMTVPLAAWPGTAGTLIMDVSYASESGGRPRLWGTDHTSGALYEHRTQLSGGNTIQAVLASGGVLYAANMIVPSQMHAKHLVALTWGANIMRGYNNGLYMAGTGITTANITTPDTKFWLMGYDVNSSGTLRSFVSFAKELSSIQVADATLALKKWRNRS